MGEGFLAKGIRRAGRNCILIGVCGLALIAVLFWAEGRYFYNFFHGPFPIDRATLLSIDNPGQPRQAFVTVEGDKSFRTGFEETETEYFVTTHHPIYGLKVGERILFVMASGDTEAITFSGELTRISPEMQEKVISVLAKRHPEAKDAFLPFMLDATNYRLNGYVGIAAGTVTGLALVWVFGTGMLWTARPETHPVWKKLAKYGSARQLGALLDAEFRSEGGGETFGSAHLTRTWLAISSPCIVDVMRMADTVWAYQHVVKHYHSGIPTGKSHFIKVFDRSGATTMIRVKKNVGPAFLAALQRRVPWAMFGFTADLDQMWKQRRGDFLQNVEQQKKKAQAPAETKAAAPQKELTRV